MSDEQSQVQDLQGIARGDKASFGRLFQLHQQRVYSYLVRLLGDRALADDIAQETWLRVVQGAAEFRPLAPVRAWIFRIARNLAFNELRQRRKWSELEAQEEAQLPDLSEPLEELVKKEADMIRLREAIEKLPDQQRIILVMSLAEDLSQAEMAKELETSVGAVKLLLFRARENLRKSLAREGA